MTPSAHLAALAVADRDLAAADPLMHRLIARHGPCTLKPHWRRGPYESLVRAVMHQQLHGNAAAAILARFVELHPGNRFPAPSDVLGTSDEALRGAGLSRQKISYVRAIAEAAVAGVVPVSRSGISHLDDEAIIGRFTQVRGVGRWTVEMFLIFGLGRLDVLPIDDYGVRAGFLRHARGRGDVKPRELGVHGERWAPYRSVAAWYLWRAVEA
jgi:DNA-3-methyladenine glycosylase II